MAHAAADGAMSAATRDDDGAMAARAAARRVEITRGRTASARGRERGARGATRTWVAFRVSSGQQHGADPRRLLAIACRRGDIAGTDVGAIRVERSFSIVNVASEVAAAFEQNTLERDARDPSVMFRRDTGGSARRATERPKAASRSTKARASNKRWSEALRQRPAQSAAREVGQVEQEARRSEGRQRDERGTRRTAVKKGGDKPLARRPPKKKLSDGDRQEVGHGRGRSEESDCRTTR